MRRPTAPRTAAIRTAARRPAAGTAALRVATRPTVVPAVDVDDGIVDIDVEAVLAAMEILAVRSEHLADLTCHAWRWSSTGRRQVLAAADELLDRLCDLRARLAALDDDVPPWAG